MDAFLKHGLLVLVALASLAAAGLSATDSAYTQVGWLGAGLLLCAAVIARSPKLGTIVTALFCAGSNGYLFSRKWELAKQTQAWCKIGETFDCDKINSSAWSEAFGIPITLLGLGFYLGLAIAAVVASSDLKRFYQLSTVFAIVNLVYSAFLGYQQFVIGKLCIPCTSIYIGNALLLWAGFAGLKQVGGALASDLGGVFGSRAFPALAGTFLAVVMLGGYAYENQKPTAPIVTVQDDGQIDASALGGYFHQPRGTIVIDGTEPVLGDSNAPYELVEWADFGCPHCADAAKMLKPFLQEHPDIKLRFKVYPRSGECHPGLEKWNPALCDAAVAAECAHQQGKFWPYQAALFENQGYFAPEDLKFHATRNGLDVPAFEQCMKSESALQSVVEDGKAGDNAGVFGTPTFFLKGTHGDRWITINGPIDVIGQIVEAHKSGAKLPEPAEPPPPPQP